MSTAQWTCQGSYLATPLEPGSLFLFFEFTVTVTTACAVLWQEGQKVERGFKSANHPERRHTSWKTAVFFQFYLKFLTADDDKLAKTLTLLTCLELVVCADWQQKLTQDIKNWRLRRSGEHKAFASLQNRPLRLIIMEEIKIIFFFSKLFDIDDK